MTDVLGHLFYAVLVLGLIYVGQGRPIGWALRAIGELGWVVIGLIIGMTSVWIWGLVFVAIDFYNWRKWNERHHDRHRDDGHRA